MGECAPAEICAGLSGSAVNSCGLPTAMDATMDLAQYSAMETMRDGRPLEIRALKPADRDGLLSALNRMSDESIQRRFFGPKRHFDEKEVAYYTDVDFVEHVALVAVVEEHGRAVIVGGARY